MRRVWVVILVAMLMGGCSSAETFEKVEDVYAAPAMAVSYELMVDLPDDAAKQTIQKDIDVLYICDNYLLSVQKTEGGDIGRTVRQVTGFDKDALTMIRTTKNGFDRWNCAWTVSGEEGHQVCRAVILDDGTLHHVVTVMADAALAAELSDEWQRVLSTATLVSTG